MPSPISYAENPNTKVSSATIADVLKAGLDATKYTAVGNKAGDAAAAIAGAAKKIEAVYTTPNLHHVTMEPMNCTAKWTEERCEVWVPTQNGDASLAACAEAAGLKPEQCEVYKLHLGGGFGRRGFQDYVTKAVSSRQADPRRADQARLEPRGGHAAGLFPAHLPMQAVGRSRRQRRPRWTFDAHLRAVDLGHGGAGPHGEWRRLDHFPGPLSYQRQPRGRSRDRLHHTRTSPSITQCAISTIGRASGAA